MKTTKEFVYEFVQKEIYTKNEDGIETKTVADALDMQRSNVSALLNDLVKDGLLKKTSTRPVLYTLPHENNSAEESSAFTNLVGYDGSLKNAIQLAKAAVLYPRKSLNVLLASKNGCGTTAFANLTFQFAVENRVFDEDAPFVKINCRHYAKSITMLNDELFGKDNDLETNSFARAKGGVLFIDNVDMLDAKQQSRILDFLDTGRLFSEDKSKSSDFSDVVLLLALSPQGVSQFNRKIPVTIELPELKDRPMSERLELINHLFTIEAVNSDCSIEVTTEAIKALLLTEFTFNVKELLLEIKAACANAYVRVVNEKEDDIHVCLNDFKSGIKKCLLNAKDLEPSVLSILNISDVMVYDKAAKSYKPKDGDKNHEDDLYAEIRKQYDELTVRGINSSSIENVINTHIQFLFKKNRYYHDFNNANDLDQLSKIVDHRILRLVGKFLEGCKKYLGKEFKSNVFYGFCLHVNSLMTLNSSHQRINNEQIVNIIKKYPQEYAASTQFADLLKSELNMELPIEEVIIISMFLIESEENENEGNPVLLYILHGNGTATSLKDVTNALTQCNNAYSYDLKLEIEAQQSMEEIKALIEKIDRGKGVIVIYDMGSIKTMIETIAEEIDVKIRYMNIPITLVGIDIARKCSMESDIDYVYHMANLEVNKMSRNEEKHSDIVVTLCHTGEGGALQLKRYINQYSKLGMKVIPLAISQRDKLLKEVIDLQRTYRIHTFVGTYDPKLLGIPFISIGKIFENSTEDLDRILMFGPVKSNAIDYSEVYKHFEEQFKYVSVPKLKTILPDVLDEFGVVYPMSEDQRVGLFMHLACLIERLLDGNAVVVNSEKSKILGVFKDEYNSTRKLLGRLEKSFNVIIDDNEIATIIMIIKKI
ncbi:MAG: PRD domain-containing protein [Anaerorhabdus sp.]